MTQAWTAECVVSADLARSLIEGQFPTLAPARVHLLGAGWDNTAFRVNDLHVFRFPRRAFAVQFLEAEIHLLPALAPRLPLRIPTPTFMGRPTDTYPWPFSGYPMIPGRTACVAALHEDQRCAAAVGLARFLAALHAIPVAEAARHGAGHDKIPRLDLGRYIPRARDLLDQLLRARLLEDIRPFRAILDAAPAAYHPRADTLVHGDLYARHLLVDPSQQLAGVIDWGDVHLGDPAVDLMIVSTFLPLAGRELFFHVYGQIPEVTRQIARLRGLWHTLTVVAYAHAIGDTDLLREAQIGLRHLALE